MNGPRAADELIVRASKLSADQVANLAKATRKTIGGGLRAYLGLRNRALRAANSAAGEALKRANMQDEMGAKAILVNDAVLSASVAAAEIEGRDTSGVHEAWRHFQGAVDLGNSRERQEAFRLARKAFRRGIGSDLTRQWPMASIGATWALVAILIWDQATEEGPYTIRDREILTRPWLMVSLLPA